MGTPIRQRIIAKMPTTRLNFDRWRLLAKESPERVVDQFLTRLQMLSRSDRQSWFTAMPGKHRLLYALKIAVSADAQPLSCVPYVLQDMFDVQGLPTSCGAPFTTPFESALEESSLLYQKLNTLGACFFGKTTPSEFGVDLQGRNPTYGNCKHSDGLQYVSGGGAGATVRTVASGLVPLGFGLDTGGGIRIPAAFHGLFGFRMGNNAYARDGVFPIAPSIESVAWVNNCIDDLRTTFKAFHKVSNYNSLEAPRGYLISELSRRTSTDIKSGLLGLTRELEIGDDPVIGTRLRKTLAQAKSAYQILEARELYSIHQYWIEEYDSQYDRSLLRRIKEGLYCKPTRADDCSHIQETIRTTFTEFFEEYDYLVLPISPIATPEKSEWSDKIEQDILQLIAPASIAFLPSLILPFNCANGRHSAAQLIINPRKLHIVPELLDQLTGHYED